MADINPEQFVSVERQQELLRVARSGRPFGAIRQAICEAVEAERERCAKVAEWSCMVPPDGGSPTTDEIAVADRAAAAIRTGVTP